MKRQTTAKRSLKLSTNTIRVLHQVHLGEVVGGLMTNNPGQYPMSGCYKCDTTGNE